MTVKKNNKSCGLKSGLIYRGQLCNIFPAGEMLVRECSEANSHSGQRYVGCPLTAVFYYFIVRIIFKWEYNINKGIIIEKIRKYIQDSIKTINIADGKF